MVWCHKYKLIFIHVPKTGGTSIEKILNLRNNYNGYGILENKALQHLKWNSYKLFLGDNIFNNYYKFSVVRNPIDRLISEYYWTPLKFGYKSGKSFDIFLNKCEEIVNNSKYKKTKYHDHFIPQYLFLCDKNDKIKVNKIFKFEEFEKINKFLKKYNNNKLEHTVKNKFKKNIVLTSDQKNRIFSLYKKDFLLFNYKIN
jgi:hypothetical protein